MLEKKTLSFPLWVEGTLVVILLVMAGVEYMHNQWFWAAIFGMTGVGVGVSIIARLRAGDKNGQA